MQAVIKGFENYCIDDAGRVYNTKTQKYRKPSITKQGYCSVDLYNKGVMKRFLIHRLVANAFIPNPLKLPQVNHKDENPLNNDVNNLEWCTAKYNMNYGEGAKTRHLKIDYSKPIYKKIARENGKLASKPIIQISIEGKILNRFSSIKEATQKLNIKNHHISSCAAGKRKTSNGYIWKYEGSDDLSQYQY